MSQMPIISSRLFTAVSSIYRHVAKMSCITPKEYTSIIKNDDVMNFCRECMQHVGVSEQHSEALGKVLLAADYRGHYSHGLNRLEMYVLDVEKKICEINKEPIILKESVSTAFVDGKNCLGPVVGTFSMELAIKKAKETGVAWVAAKGSNHYGIAGWYSLLAAQKGLIGLSFTNTSPLVYPTRARKRAVGTNPLTVAAPGHKVGDEFVLDMATSAVALGKLEMCRRRSLPIPHGWAADHEGKSTSVPSVAISDGALLPLGGEEDTSGYKGFGLGMMVELFCGILAGATYGENVRSWMNTNRKADLGQGFVAIDPSAFAPDFKDRMQEYMDSMRHLPRASENNPVLVPGDPERAHMEECAKLGGIRYPPVLIESMNKLADRLDVKRMPVLKNLKIICDE